MCTIISKGKKLKRLLLNETQHYIISYSEWAKIQRMRWNSKMSRKASIQPNFLLLSPRSIVTYFKFKECLKYVNLF